MEKETDNASPSGKYPMEKRHGTEPSGEFFDELQALWDKHSSRVDRLVAESGNGPLLPQTHRPPMPYRHKLLAVYAVLSLIFLFLVIYWAILIPSLVFTTISLITCLTIEAVYILIFLQSLTCAICLLVYSPARTGILHMKPFTSQIRFGAHHIATASAAAVFVLIVVSCTTTGDGHTITQNHPDRSATIESVTTILNNMQSSNH